MVKIFVANEKGKIELTEKELQKLLEEAHNEGYMEGHNEGISKNVPPIIYPPITTPTYPITYEPTWVWRPYWWEVTCNNSNTYTYSSTTDASTTVR